MSQATSRDSVLEAATMRRVSWRLMPFRMLAYLLCCIDGVVAPARSAPERFRREGPCHTP